jgi:hypothetical protein
MTQLNPSEPQSGSGPLVVIQLRGKRAAEASLVGPASVQLAQRDGIEIPSTVLAGRIEVIAPSGGQPASTSEPERASPTPETTETPGPEATQVVPASPQPTEALPTVTPAGPGTPLARASEPTAAVVPDEAAATEAPRVFDPEEPDFPPTATPPDLASSAPAGPAAPDSPEAQTPGGPAIPVELIALGLVALLTAGAAFLFFLLMRK